MSGVWVTEMICDHGRYYPHVLGQSCCPFCAQAYKMSALLLNWQKACSCWVFSCVHYQCSARYALLWALILSEDRLCINRGQIANGDKVMGILLCTLPM